MKRKVWHIYRLGLKELISFRYDFVLVALVIYCFTIMIIVPSKGTGLQVRNSSVAYVDEDCSALSARIIDAIQEPHFKKPRAIAYSEIDRVLDNAECIFVIHIPRGFQRDVLAGKNPGVRIDVDATAIGHARLGAGYLMRIINDEINTFVTGVSTEADLPIRLVTRVLYNQNRENSWYMSVVFLTQMITMLSIVLPTAALIKEKERGTVEHLLVMPLLPVEITIAKVWANSFIVATGAMFSLFFAIKGVIGAPIHGSTVLFLFGTVVFLYAATELGVFLATIAKNMPQAGLLSMPIIVPIGILHGGTTPLESMPPLLQNIMQFAPTTHYLEFCARVLFKDAGLGTVWPQLVAMALIGTVLFIGAMYRFKATFR
ncbi:MAG: Inner membrane transport permease YhhJ [Deltaproteobacteria bacterium ADurb.BinA179]|nr:MAG: Inner membrane transport permease YhhJ [Deltaproteobacteria bacterium ADurb.BinA179]